MANRYCSNCGHALAQGDRFCAECGKPAQESVQETSQAVGTTDRQELTGVAFREARKPLPWEPKYFEVYYKEEKAGEITKVPFGGAWHFDGSRESYQSRDDAAYALIQGEAPVGETVSAPPPQAPPGEGMRRAGSTMMGVGCLLTLLITIPIVLLVLVLLVAG